MDGMTPNALLAVALGALTALVFFVHKVWPRRMQRGGGPVAGGPAFRRIVEDAGELTALVGEGGRVRFVNRAFDRLLGYGGESLQGGDMALMVHPQDLAPLKQLVQEVLAGMGPREMRLRWRHRDGGWLATDARVWALPDGATGLAGAVVQARDLSGSEALDEALTASRKRFEDFAANSADWLWEVNERMQFCYVSPAVRQVIGYAPDELAGVDMLHLLFENPEDTARELIEARVERREAFREIEFWSKTRLGERVYLRLSAVPVWDEHKVFKGYRGVASDTTMVQEDRENMYRLATTDHLTGLLNRPRFKEELERAVSLARRHKTEGMVMFIDLDRFKEVNDTHGHEAGDAILVEVARILRESVRSTDVVARLGGDEFAVIMHNIGLDEARAKVERIIERIASFRLDYHGSKLTVTMSAGMVQYPQEDKGADHLLMSADLAMYRAKDMGRNRLFLDVEDAGAGTTSSVRAQLRGVERLRQCLDSGDFQLYYQPIVGTTGEGKPLFECLLRIFDEEGKMLSPALYIDAAEHFGLIQRLDLAVVRRAFETQKALQEKKIEADFSINLSCRSLGDRDFMEKVKALCHEIDIVPQNFVFEVTETMALHDPAEMRDIADIEVFVKELRDVGFRFALDDFGTGFTSFKYLKILPVDIVKIDGEYIKDLTTVPEDRLFVESMVGLCRGLGILTVAEFVEDEAVTREILALGIDYGQGWHFGKPLPDIEALVAAFKGKRMQDWLTDAGAVKAANAVEKAARKQTNGAKKTARKGPAKRPVARSRKAAARAGSATA